MTDFSKLKPLKNYILFQFLDDTGGQKGRFHHTTLSGIIIPPSVNNQKVHRWAKVFAAGPEAQVKEGDLILIESLMWMEGVKFDGQTIWKTDDSKILAVTDDINECQTQ